MQTNAQLTDGRVRLRPCRPADAEAVYAAVRESMAELSTWTPWGQPGYSMSGCRQWLESRADAWSAGREFDFVILDAEDGAFLGGCGLNDINRTHNFANLGYWVRTSRTGQGIATAVTRLVGRFGFEALGFTRLEIVTAVGNRASQRVAKKAGATREGIERNRHVIGDTVHDVVMFSLIPADLKRNDSRTRDA